MAVWMLTRANLRSKKGMVLSMGILMLLSVAMLHVGMTLIFGIQDFYERENEQLAGPHYVLRFYGNEYEDRYLDFFKSDSRVESVDSRETVLMEMAQYPEGGTVSVTFKNMDQPGSITGYRIVESVPVSPGRAVYLPQFMKDMGYQAGGTFSIISNRQTCSFEIAGFLQSTWFATTVASLVDIYMPESAFTALYEKAGSGYSLSVRLKNPKELSALQQDFKDDTGISIEAIAMDAKIMEFTLDEMKNGCTMIVTIISAVLLAFSCLMTLVAILVMKFRTSNHIETQMVNIGALEAMGYTGKQIKWSIALEFFFIGCVSIPLGILLSYGIIAALGRLIVNSVGVAYHNKGHMGYNVIIALAMLAVILLISQASARKAAKITPIKALRQGMESHSFQKNHLPLHKSKGPVSLLLGLKQVVFHKRTYLMTGLIFAAVSFACASAVILFLNMGLDDSLALQMTGYEISDILVYKAPHADYDRLVSEIKQVDGVRKTSLYEAKSVMVEEKLLTCYLSDDFDSLEMVEGNFPRYDNEIAITGVLAKGWGKQIGDQVSVRSADGTQMDYIICGFSQTMSNFGQQCFLNLSAYQIIEPSYERQTIQVYLEPGKEIDFMIRTLESRFKVSSPTFQEELKGEMAQARKTAEDKISALFSMYGVDSAQYALMADGEIILSGDTSQYQIDRIVDNRRLFISNVDIFASSIALMAGIIVTATVLIIMLFFYIVIKTMLVRRRKEFGIYKAMGYTDGQLMKQVAISFLPSSVGGSILGMLLGYLNINRVSSIMFERLGISRLELTVNPVVLIALGLVIVLLSYGISLVVSRKMKQITVYELLTEV